MKNRKSIAIILALLALSSCEKVEDLTEDPTLDSKFYQVEVFSDSAIFEISINESGFVVKGDTASKSAYHFSGKDSLKFLEFKKIKGKRTDVSVTTLGVKTVLENVEKM